MLLMATSTKQHAAVIQHCSSLFDVGPLRAARVKRGIGTLAWRDAGVTIYYAAPTGSVHAQSSTGKETRHYIGVSA